MNIAGVGTIKTAVEQATQYVEEIKSIKADVERQCQEITAAVTALKTEISEARAETKAVGSRVMSLERDS